MMSRLLLLAILALSCLVRPADAAEPVRVAQGDRVRLVVYDERALTGRLLAFDARTLDVAAEPDSARRSLSRDAIAVIEVEVEKTHAGRGAVVGFVLGGMVGILLARPDEDGETATTPATGFITGALVGAVAGALVGRTGSSRHWKEATIP
jgi:hypothetical protein